MEIIQHAGICIKEIHGIIVIFSVKAVADGLAFLGFNQHIIALGDAVGIEIICIGYICSCRRPKMRKVIADGGNIRF